MHTLLRRRADQLAELQQQSTGMTEILGAYGRMKKEPETAKGTDGWAFVLSHPVISFTVTRYIYSRSTSYPTLIRIASITGSPDQ